MSPAYRNKKFLPGPQPGKAIGHQRARQQMPDDAQDSDEQRVEAIAAKGHVRQCLWIVWTNWIGLGSQRGGKSSTW